MPEINYNTTSKMERGFPRVRKLGAVSPYGEMTPFVHGGRLASPPGALHLQQQRHGHVRVAGQDLHQLRRQ